ncbi:hypothetical protein [Pseudomonas sp. ESBL2]|uniref:hypothetical protein n=1 Tax=Pseudomonas sp. ESBL2 TaxID=3077325 RepID=UPI002FCC80E2
MPTENRSSNTEMVSLSRFSLEAARDCLVICQDQAFQSCECESCPQCGLMPDECTGTECSKTCQCTTCEHCMNKDSIDSLTTLLARPVPQPHPEPIAWMVGTAIWWTKEEAERDSVATGLPIVGLGPMTESSAPAIPDGYCLMPRRLTAENGAKALLLGEFKLEVTRECPECLELDEPAEGCEICDGEGEYAQRHTIPWDKIKFIYNEAVKGLALQPSAAP